MGIQRAPTIIAAYLIKYANITYEDVIKYIKQKRKMCFYKGVNFKTSLLAFEKKIQTF
jgi:protein-tyrosine phosphatase